MRHGRFLAVLAIVAALLVLPATTVAAQAATAATTYTITDLGDLGGGASFAYGINNQSQVQVVGESYTTVPDPTAPPQNPPITEVHGFLWQNGKMQDLGTYGTDPDSIANGINDNGQIAGAAHDYSYNDLVAFLWDKKFTALPTLGGPQAFAYSLNASTQTTGWADLKATDPAGGYQFHAVIWSASNIQDLKTLGGLDSAGYSINVQGHVAGASDTTSNVHAFLWDGSQMRDLGALGKQTNDSVSAGEAVNDKDQVVGLTYTDVPDSCFGGTQIEGFVWQASTTMQPLAPLSGDCDAAAFALNNSGQSVGLSEGGTTSSPTVRAVIWSGGNANAVDLNTLLPANSGWSLLAAYGINDKNQIVGIGITSGKLHGFLLAPASSAASPTAHRTQAPLTREQIKALSLVLHSRYFGKLGGRLKI